MLGLHPNVSEVVHLSFPGAGQNPLPRVMDLIASGDVAGVVLVTRDSNAVLRAQKSGGSFKKLERASKIKEGLPIFHVFEVDVVSNWVACAHKIVSHAQECGVKFSLTSYEQLIQIRQLALERLFQSLDLDPHRYEFFEQPHTDRSEIVKWDPGYTTSPIDGNTKYYLPLWWKKSKFWFRPVTLLRNAGRRLISEILHSKVAKALGLNQIARRLLRFARRAMSNSRSAFFPK